jgi:hypothetical protein
MRWRNAMQNRPYIMVIDDEPQALTAALDALARLFFRISVHGAI